MAGAFRFMDAMWAKADTAGNCCKPSPMPWACRSPRARRCSGPTRISVSRAPPLPYHPATGIAPRIKQQMHLADLSGFWVCRIPFSEQRTRAIHMASRRVNSIDHLPRPLIRTGLSLWRTKHDDQVKAVAFVFHHSLDDMIQVVAAARKSIERGNGRVATILSQCQFGLRTALVGFARYIQHLPLKASTARVIERGLFEEGTARPILAGIEPRNAA